VAAAVSLPATPHGQSHLDLYLYFSQPWQVLQQNLLPQHPNNTTLISLVEEAVAAV
jgi:hypothetical protein